MDNLVSTVHIPFIQWILGIDVINIDVCDMHLKHANQKGAKTWIVIKLKLNSINYRLSVVMI